MKKIVSFMIVLALIAGLAIIASPYWAVYQLKKAYDTKDIATINASIDFPKVQQSVKSQLNPILLEKAHQLTKSPFLQLLNIELNPDDIVGTLVNKAVDNSITADGVNYVITGQSATSTVSSSVKLLGGLLAVAMDKIDIQDLLTARNQDALLQKAKQQLTAPNPNAVPVDNAAKYCGFNCFYVNTPVKGYPVTLELQRHGWVTWQVVGVKLPL